ncbi:DUF4175 family protein [Mucilaginibacter ginsenosidivorans]|uniref:DUF4175 family protein n=1 Tax=Mucilaginibacter ginsenosidivorans TaxID=398053 RepID=A0A5B8URG7_9SPHI|nr:DUF4175 family protein [Mucilaginibacter ginsenosidivorans]QEC61677.1 hypothetical protein FRZ54_03455 [Mucilaginibacter ginsenosidivorans]
MRTPENYELLIGKINTFIRKYYLNNLLRGLIFLGAGLFSAYVIITVGEYYGDFNTTFRTFLFYFFIILNVGLIAWLVIPSLMAWLRLGKTITHDQAAEIIGKHFTDVSDRLLNTLQLKKLADNSPESRALIDASIDQKIETLKPVRFPSAVNIRENTKYLKWIIFPIAIICVIALAAPSILTESTKKLIRHNEYFAPVAPFKFVLLNNSLSAIQGQDLKIDLKLDGDKLPADVYIETGSNTFKLDKENISRFHYQFSNLQKNTSFRFIGNGFQSQAYEVKVSLKPSLLHFDVALTYPVYLHKKNETIANAGDLTIPAGTIVKWQLHTQNADGIGFSINDKTTEASPGGTDVFEHTERILKNSIYKLAPVSNAVNRGDSAAYRINAIRDELPAITVNEKSDSVSSKALYFDGKIQDDHGFSSLTFNYKIGTPGNKNEERMISKSVKADLGQTQSDFFYYWNLKDIAARPGDQVSYYFEVADNDGVTGPKRVRSPERTLNIPDQRQVNDQLDKGTQVVKEKMESAIKLAGQIEHDSQKLNQMLLNKNTLSFDEKKQIDDLLEKKKELDDLVKDIQAENKKNAYERRENQQQTKELEEKQKQIENLFNNVLDKKTRDLLQKLQELMNEEQKDGTRDQLSKMQMDNKSLRKELDRILELYKKLEFDQKLDQSVNQLNQLAEKQQKLADQAKQSDASQQELQQQQEKLKQDFQDVKKSLDDLQKQDEASGKKNDFENPKDDEQKIDEQMQQSSESLQKNDKQKASEQQQQASKQMQQLASKLQQKNEEQEDSQNNVDAQQLRELLKNLVNSSFEQEKVMETLKNTSPSDPNYSILAQKQKDIKDNLKTAEDSLYSLSKRVPQIQSTVNQEIAGINEHIDKALDNLSDRRTPEAGRNQQYAMTSMNNLALMLNEALEQLQNSMKNSKGGGGKSKQPSLSQLNKMQQQLNQNMQKMRDQLQKQGNMSQSQRSGMSQQLARMAREQQIIREALDKISQEENKDGTGRLGNLDKISKEMEQTENDIVNRRITDDLLKRQQQIQTRLLEAEKAERQQEQDQQRESNAGKDLPPGYIKALQDYQKLNEKQTEQVKTVSPALNLYYKQKIKSYFDQLNAH